jgi:hypothetical protein
MTNVVMLNFGITQHNNMKHNNTQHSNTQHNNTQHKDEMNATLSITTKYAHSVFLTLSAVHTKYVLMEEDQL